MIFYRWTCLDLFSIQYSAVKKLKIKFVITLQNFLSIFVSLFEQIVLLQKEFVPYFSSKYTFIFKFFLLFSEFYECLRVFQKVFCSEKLLKFTFSDYFLLLLNSFLP
jgi:hypothetical protein